MISVGYLLSAAKILTWYGAGRLKPTKNQYKNNFRTFSTTTTSGLIEVLRIHSCLILCFLIFDQGSISGDSKISNYPCRVVFEVTFAKPHHLCVLCKQNRLPMRADFKCPAP